MFMMVVVDFDLICLVRVWLFSYELDFFVVVEVVIVIDWILFDVVMLLLY